MFPQLEGHPEGIFMFYLPWGHPQRHFILYIMLGIIFIMNETLLSLHGADGQAVCLGS